MDHLDSREEAERMRRQLFDDPFLLPELVFVSPGGHGVKTFVPYDLGRTSDVKQNAAENIYWLMEYARLRYGDCSDKDKGKGVDYSGKDLVRACFLSHDERALMRVKTPMGSCANPHAAQNAATGPLIQKHSDTRYSYTETKFT